MLEIIKILSKINFKYTLRVCLIVIIEKVSNLLTFLIFENF